MLRFKILYDELQEADWFRSLHPDLADAEEVPITGTHPDSISRVLAYDRPDIVLVDGTRPILVVEETVEVPSGHNVGQRFARIAAAAEAGVPCLYFGPYVARKHGGETEGPRYMNVRLFHALDAMISETGSAVTTINWPVDDDCEVRRDSLKDADVREYVSTVLDIVNQNVYSRLNELILESAIHRRMVAERERFIEQRIKRADQYDSPPPSVEIMSARDFTRRAGTVPGLGPDVREIVLYKVGMTYMRSDPYTGMALLYRYLYRTHRHDRGLVLWFPSIRVSDWRAVAASGRRKDVRLFKLAADGILFADHFHLASDL